MNAALACAYSIRAVTPRRANCRGFGPGSLFSASRAVASPAWSRPLPGVGSETDPATDRMDTPAVFAADAALAQARALLAGVK